MSFRISRAPVARCRVVYFGPPGAGKGTSLRHIYEHINPLRKGELRQRRRGAEQVLELSFDAKIRNTVARVSLATLTGPVSDPQALVDILEGVQGLVLVADSAPSAFGANLRSLQLVEQALGVMSRKLSAVPHVLQYNKRDLPDALPIAELDDALNRYGVASFATVATEGREIESTLVALTASVLDTRGSDDSRSSAAPVHDRDEPPPELSPLEVAERRNLKRKLSDQRRKTEIGKALHMAEHFFEQADYAECLRWARKALHKDPDQARARLLFDRAKGKLDELVEQLYADAIAARGNGDLAGAAERAEHALELHPHHRGFELLLEEIRLLTHRALAPAPAPPAEKPTPRPPSEDPVVTARKTEVVNLIRESEELLARADHRGALAVLERLAANAPRMPGEGRSLLSAVEQRRRAVFDALLASARERMKAGDPDGALESLNLILDHDPNDARALALVDKAGTAAIRRAGSRGDAPSARPGAPAADDGWDLASLLDPNDPRAQRGPSSR